MSPEDEIGARKEEILTLFASRYGECGPTSSWPKVREVQGKEEDMQAGRFVTSTLIQLAKEDGSLWDEMQEHRIAPYSQRYNSFIDVITKLDGDNLEKSTLDELQSVRGISTKTSRFFLTHSVEKFDDPILDTHILRFLSDFGYRDVPKSTPQNPKVYERFSRLFRSIARFEGKSVADFDLEVWTKYSYGN